MTLTRRTPAASYGSRDFLTLLSAREAALGLADVAPVADVRQPDPEPEPAPQEAPASEPLAAHDKWGNRIVTPRGAYGQHAILSAWDGRIIRVCGEMASGRHNAWWVFDEDELRPVCSKCWPQAQGRR